MRRGFRTQFEVPAAPADAVLRVRALKRINVLIDGKLVAAPPVPDDELHWKRDHVVQLAPHLGPGRHELTIVVLNENGPAALWASSDGLGVHTDSTWVSSKDGAVWTPARLAKTRPPVALAQEFERPRDALLARLPIFVATFVLITAASIGLGGRGATPRVAARSSAVRWWVLGAWALMAANNILKLPAKSGFDVGSHLDYVDYLIAQRRIPLATDGWQMFQSPLNYLISAPLLAGLSKLFEPTTAVLLLRIVPLVCGALQIELCYRAVRRVFPEREDLQALGTIFAGFLPMNVYASQYVGNEPLAAALSAAVFLLCLKLLRPEPGEDLRWTPLWTGALFGLALLAKVSAVVMSAPLLVTLACASLGAESPVRTALGRMGRTSAVVFGVAALVAGWYYVRNWLYLGQPFVGGWDPARGMTWWQEPGYRTASQYLSFGRALIRPVYAVLESFWDGFYATFWSDSYLSGAATLAGLPRWNFGFMLASVLLAAVPTTALVLGLGIAMRRAVLGSHPVWLIVLACVGSYCLALVHHSLTLPYYCAIKAFYTLGATPAYALLAVAGFDVLMRDRFTKAVVHGLVACWALSVYVAYFAWV